MAEDPAYKARNTARARQAQADWRARHPGVNALRCAADYQKHHDQRLANAREYAIANRERIRAYTREYSRRRRAGRQSAAPKTMAS